MVGWRGKEVHMRLRPFQLGPQPSEAASSESPEVWAGSSMKHVLTPDGPQTVIVDRDQFVEEQRQRFNERFEEKEAGLVFCRRCCRETVCVVVAHYCADMDPLLLPVYCARRDQLDYREVTYCPECDPVPESSSLPIAPYGTYYNLVH